jgi:hypothetical protein
VGAAILPNLTAPRDVDGALENSDFIESDGLVARQFVSQEGRAKAPGDNRSISVVGQEDVRSVPGLAIELQPYVLGTWSFADRALSRARDPLTSAGNGQANVPFIDCARPAVDLDWECAPSSETLQNPHKAL